MKKIVLIGLILITFFSIVSAQYFAYNDCLIIDTEQNAVVYPTFVDLSNRGVYEYFIPSARPQPIIGFKPDVQISLVTGTPLNDLRCN